MNYMWFTLALSSVLSSLCVAIPDCPPCSRAQVRSCPVVEESESCQLVLEPNCGCCLMCAKRELENCGVATGTCGSGLMCAPRPSKQLNRNLIVENSLGRFICVKSGDYDAMMTDVLEASDGGGDEPIYEPLFPPLRGGRLNEVPKPPPTQSKKPCFDHFDKVWAKEYFSHHDWVPDCRKNGLYYKLQCETTFGLVRGRCWCVNRFGRRRGGFVSQPFVSECRRKHRS